MNKDIYTDPALRGISAEGIGRSNLQLGIFDYMAGIPGNENITDLIEVQFKSTRKAFYRNSKNIPLKKGDMICVEASPGYDLGVVTLTGGLVLLQMKKKRVEDNNDIKNVLRQADRLDLDILAAARQREKSTMIRTREIAKELGLSMKISDVEFQGDGKKAIFYYIAEQRVDFRKLIKVLAEEFGIRIEMRQIGARQEAALVGGIGSCGRELCSATWKNNFETISTHAARLQDLSLNPTKLTGVCGKLKSCLNYELALYEEASRTIPDRNIVLETQEQTYYFFKADLLQQRVTYSTEKRMAANLVTISAQRALEIIKLNKNGEKPVALQENAAPTPNKTIDLAEQDELTRFDHLRKTKKKKHHTAGEHKAKENKAKTERRNEKKQSSPQQNEKQKNQNPNQGTRSHARHRNQQQQEKGNNEQQRHRNNKTPKQPNQQHGEKTQQPKRKEE